jgi:hypothetical protein
MRRMRIGLPGRSYRNGGKAESARTAEDYQGSDSSDEGGIAVFHTEIRNNIKSECSRFKTTALELLGKFWAF